MRRSTLSSTIILLVVVTSVAAQPPTATLDQETLGSIERLDPAFDNLVAAGAEIEVLAKGFSWSEGPVWVPQQDGGHLLFSDPVDQRATATQWARLLAG